VELEEGQWLTGFICENNGLEGATDITEYGGCAWLASRENVKQL
jgi:allophanate hydrolase